MNRYAWAASVAAISLGLGLAPAANAANKPPKDPVVATVNGKPIHLSDVAKAAQSLPPQLQQAPPQELYPVLLNRLIDERALLVEAQKTDLSKQPKVAKAMKEAADQALEAAYLRRQVKPQINDAAAQAYYKAHYTDKKQPEQVEARQILVKTKTEAEKIIDKLNKGAKFSDLAQKYSIDPGAKNGGELGWFTKSEMVKPFADAAFALKVGQYTKTPVQSQFGWHIIKLQGRRQEPVPSFDDVKETIHQKVANKAITDALEKARKSVKVKIFNADGTAMTPGGAPGLGAPPAGGGTDSGAQSKP
ncbi:MAG TPA: peptidylprolyl isomerase [Acetobacteraceae bacterium]|nr:peptidylprolyl isomerase [Acetobacteraceae bacterium]